MCGICGFITDRSVEIAMLRRMNDAMSHRGPDDSGEELLSHGGRTVGLAQRRLSIQDLSDHGHQPMKSEDGRVLVVYNGEVYNFKELRRELTDYPFRSECDTEVILAMYLREGMACLGRFNGMFAIAIYDQELDALFLARDRMGQKPLYYYRGMGDFVFASELKPVMLFDAFPRKIRRDVLKSYLFHGYIKGPETIFEQVWKVRPGTYLEYRDGRIKETEYWRLADVCRERMKSQEEDYEKARRELGTRLRRAVEYRMIADVPVGAFLSGGYDSSLIAALAQESCGGQLRTYSIGFHDERYDEAPYAAEVAGHLGTKHTEYYITGQDMLSLLGDLPRYYDEPFADSSQIPSMLVSKLAGQDVKVVLTGDGGDELFCGYEFYGAVRKAQDTELLGRALRSVLRLPLPARLKLLDRFPESVRGIAMSRNRELKTQFLNFDRRLLCDELMGEESEVAFSEEEALSGFGDWQLRRMMLDMMTFLPDDILCKVDRATMKYGIEGRCPLLDKDVVEYSFAIPHKFKYDRRAGGKKILKSLAYDWVPEELLSRPKKGFAVPVEKWLREELREELLACTDKDFLSRQGLFDAGRVQSAVSAFLRDTPARSGRYVRTLWHLFIFQKWYDTYMMDFR